jgi:hypothetical protein
MVPRKLSGELQRLGILRLRKCFTSFALAPLWMTGLWGQTMALTDKN